ncbi:MAG: hypothetical protein Q9162_003807 [Coniocarpon cinnabarinum]
MQKAESLVHNVARPRGLLGQVLNRIQAARDEARCTSSDHGSTFLHRTTSPAPVYRSTRDTRNNPVWNPSNVRMANVEEDEAGRLRAFRRKFGRAFDAREGMPAPAQTEESGADDEVVGTREEEGTMMEIRAGDARRGRKSEGRVSRQEDGDVEVDGKIGGDRPPAAAGKQQKEADPAGQGLGTTQAWGEDFGEDDNLMDLISSAGKEEGRPGGLKGEVRSSTGSKKGKK